MNDENDKVLYQCNCYPPPWMNYEESKLFDNPGWPRRFPRRGINFNVERFSQQIQITGSRLGWIPALCSIVLKMLCFVLHCGRLCFTASSRSILPVIAPRHYRTQGARTLPSISEHYQMLQNISEHHQTLQNISTLPNVTKHYQTLQNISEQYRPSRCL